MTTGPTKDRVRTTETVFEILQILYRMDTATLTEVTNELDMAKSTVHRHLRTLEDLEYVIEEDGRYRIGFKFLQLGEYTRTRLDAYQMARQKVKELAKETNERALFMVEEHGKGIYVFSEFGDQAVRTNFPIGSRLPLHALAAGKAILAHLPPERVDEIVDKHGLEQLTPNTIDSVETLHQELGRIRQQGFSINDEESTTGLRAIGAPLLYDEGVLGALSVSAPAHRFKGEELEQEYQRLLLGAANEVELNMRHS